MFKRLLLPTDGSELSMRAVRMGLELARTCQASVLALHVVPPFHTMSYMAEMLAATEATYTEESVARSEQFLEDISAEAKKAGVACETLSVTGDHPYQQIAQAAADRECDLIVMASHGWRGLNRLLLGSETHKVLLKTDVPVLVCH